MADLSGVLDGIVKAFPSTLKSLTLVGFKVDYSYHSEGRVLQKLVDPTTTCHIADIACKLEELSLLHCFITPNHAHSYFPHLKAIEDILGSKYKFLEANLGKKEDTVAYIRSMVKEGGDINHILCGNEKNIMCEAINSPTTFLFDVRFYSDD